MTDTKLFQVGDPVWSKMRGFCAWPSRIAAPHESSLKNTAAEKQKTPKNYYLVYFFGSNNFAWMPEDTIKPYAEFKDENEKKGKKTVQFKAGLKQIEEYIANGGKATLNEPPAKSGNNNDIATSPSAAGDSLNNDASNLDGDLPSIDEEIAAIRNKKPVPPSVSSKKLKNSHDSHDDSPSHTSSVPTSVQRDYSRTPFKSRKSTKSEESTADVTSPTKRLRATDDNFGASSLPSPTISTSTAATTTTASKATGNRLARQIIYKSSQHSEPVLDTPQINLSSIVTKAKNIRPSTLKFGFIGLGMMGQRLVKHLLNTEHQVTIWNRDRNKIEAFEKAGASSATTPCDVVNASDVTFSCVSDPAASKEILFGQFGILSGIVSEKAYVELSSIDPETSNDISDAVISKGGRFLAAPIVTNGRYGAENNDLIIIASGDRTVYEDCSSCFQAMAKRSFYLGSDCGNALKMHLILSSFYGAILTALSECYNNVGNVGLDKREFKEILKLSTMNSPLVEKAIEKMHNKNMDVDLPLQYLQKDLRMMLNMSEERALFCPIAAIVNEVLKSKRAFEGEDACAVSWN